MSAPTLSPPSASVPPSGARSYLSQSGLAGFGLSQSAGSLTALSQQSYKMSTLPPVPVKMASVLSCPVEKMSFTMPPIRQGKKENFTMHLISAREARNHQFQMNIKELSKEETARYRHSHKQNVCTAMLREGYHKAFAELYALIEKSNALREAAGPGSAIWLTESLEEQPDKLDQLQHFLTRAEAAQRAGQIEEVYKNQLALAQYFRNGEDNWLSHYFFESCLNTAKLIKVDGGRKEAEANTNLGKVIEEEGQLEKAVEHYEAFYHLTLGRKWTDETGRTHNSLACENLWRIYTSLADKMLENKEHQQAIKSLIKALQMAKEGDDKQMEGASAYRLGLAYLSAGSPEKAISTLNAYKEISEALDDIVGLGRAYEAIAKSLQSQGKLHESIQYMEKFIEIAKGYHLCQSLIEACTYLGAIYNTKGDYEKAFEYFLQAYEAALGQTADPLLLEEVRVHYSTARAHIMMVDANSHIEAADPHSIRRLVTWKEIRRDTFTDPFPVDETSDDADDEMESADDLEDENTSAAQSAQSIPAQSAQSIPTQSAQSTSTQSAHNIPSQYEEDHEEEFKAEQ